MDYILTNNGAVLMTQVAAGRTILFTRTESGSGYATNPAVLQNVIDKKQDMFLEEVIFENRQAVVKTVLSNMQLEEGYQLRQVGVYAKLEGDETDTLVVIGQQYNGEKIPPYGEGIIQIEYDIAMKVSGTGNVTIEGVGTGYVTKGQFLAHLSDYNNPHKVTAKQVGLDKVPNVGTDDQTPKFEEAEERENITSEEKLSVIFGKIRKWLSDLKAAAFCSVANNLVTTLPGSVLDARQGKELEDKISGLYSEMQIKTIPVKSNTSYLASITGRQMGHIIVLNSLSGWRQWYDGVITVGHIDIVPLIILSINAILIEGQNGMINAVCGISIVDGDIKVTIPNGWNGKYSHLCIDISFLVN